jgi:outer membrane protein assembly factor BamB
VFALVATSACGSRTDLFLTGTSATVNPVPTLYDDADPCPFAVLAGAPKPMAGYCSTRDGRARVPAPSSPHVTWTLSSQPNQDGTGVTIATDASGHAYVGAWGENAPSPRMSRIDALAGSIEWSTSFDQAGDDVMPTALLLRNGSVTIVASQTESPPSPSVESFDPAQGTTSTGARLDPGLSYVITEPAVGSDGSLYVLGDITATGALGSPFGVQRVLPGGGAQWTSVDLSTFVVPTEAVTEVQGFPSSDASTVALEPDGTVLVEFQGLTTPYGLYATVVALDPASGDERWATTFTGQPSGGLAVLPDGSIALLVTEGPDGANLVILEPGGSTRRTTTLPDANQIVAVDRDGTVFVRGQGGGTSVLVAVGPQGGPEWANQGAFTGAFLASNGVIVAYGGGGVFAIDEATGQTMWTLPAPSGNAVCDAELTSAGTLVAVDCAGAIFGASD